MKNAVCLGMLLLSAAWAAEMPRAVGQAGQFDYYLLTMSWSPSYCATHGGNPKDLQCGTGRHFAFVLHGLWPQYRKPVNGHSWPEFCSTARGLKNPSSVLDIMPSQKLVEHEWERHGTCSGLDAEAYFGLARKALESIHVPQSFVNPKEYQNKAPAAVQSEFLQANPGLKPESISVQCSANALSEVRVCLDRDLRPVPCTEQQACKAQKVRIPPVR